MKEKVPLIVRAFGILNRATSAMWRASVMVRDETLWAWTSKLDRERTNRAIYNQQDTYVPGGATFEDGLYPWECEALTKWFPPSGRILLGAAGGGRELAGLCKLGYEIVAFEPAPCLTEAARAVASPYPKTKVITAFYADLVQAAETGSGPLATHVCGREFHGVILGWTSLSYVWREERDTLLKALRKLAPHAPVLISYMGEEDEFEGRLGGVRIGFRRLLRLAGATALAQRGDRFHPWMGYYQTLTSDDVQSLAGRTGYKVAYVKSSYTAHALLMPDA